MSEVDDALTLARDAIISGHYDVSEHVVRSITGGGINIREIEDAVIKGKVIEIRDNPMRGRSFLTVGGSLEKEIHVVFANQKSGLFLIVMAYYPSPLIWKDSENRLPEGENAVNDAHENCFFCGERIKDITVGNFDYRLEGKLFVVKDVPAGLCLGCGEKYVSAKTAKRIGELVAQDKDIGREDVLVFKFG
ncbi:YgiT-type zinc finger domain protein [delta proteobacterium NaphS2]|nr:YgiT-type zinc finger domain protein [delta proteobacterium NaphS2]